MRLFTKQIRRWLKRIAALILITAGIITLPLPIPIGAILIVIGLAQLLTTNQQLGRWVKKLRQQQPAVNHKLQWLETRMPKYLARALRKTAPDYGRKPPASCNLGQSGPEPLAKNESGESR